LRGLPRTKAMLARRFARASDAACFANCTLLCAGRRSKELGERGGRTRGRVTLSMADGTENEAVGHRLVQLHADGRGSEHGLLHLLTIQPSPLCPPIPQLEGLGKDRHAGVGNPPPLFPTKSVSVSRIFTWNKRNVQFSSNLRVKAGLKFLNDFCASQKHVLLEKVKSLKLLLLQKNDFVAFFHCFSNHQKCKQHRNETVSYSWNTTLFYTLLLAGGW